MYVRGCCESIKSSLLHRALSALWWTTGNVAVGFRGTNGQSRFSTMTMDSSQCDRQ